ncbi:MAG: nucleotidyltransferase family protein, partial [bacterium]
MSLKKSDRKISPEAQERKAALEAELARILPIIIEKYEPEKIILFGSLATGEVHEWSDIDLAIIKEIKLNYFDRLLEFKKLLDVKLGTAVFIYRLQEFAARVAENHYFIIDEIIG